jgi:hypothetical protein
MANSYIRNMHVYNADEAIVVRLSLFITVKDVHILSTRELQAEVVQAARCPARCSQRHGFPECIPDHLILLDE